MIIGLFNDLTFKKNAIHVEIGLKMTTFAESFIKYGLYRMDAKKILFISQEITPYLPESEISTVSRYLPQGTQERGKEIRTFTPRFGLINERRNQLHEVIRLSGMNLIIDDTDHPLIIKVASIQSARMQVYFIDNDDFFKRKFTMKDADGLPFADNDERSIFFVRGALETIKKLRWIPDLIHCHGSIAAITGLYIKRMYADDPSLCNAKVVHSIYDEDYNGMFDPAFAQKLMNDKAEIADVEGLKNEASWLELNKLAVDFSDAVIQGSPNLNPELISYIEAKNTKMLSYQSPETYMDAYNQLYDEILAEK